MKLIDIELTRQVSGSPDEVYATWIDPSQPGSPWHGVATLILNAVEGGLFYHSVEHAGKTWAHYGRFIRLTPPRYIEHTWVSEATKGVESLLTISFDGKEGGTLVTLRHSNVPDDELGRQHKEGWTWTLDMLAGGIAKRAGG
jgi:uncharacterized protein YndB with AHSA1/START domain